MDLAYLSDAFSHMTMRTGSYVPEQGGHGGHGGHGLTVAEKHRQANRQKKLEQKKQPCSICLENKRRKLGTYIRQKSQENSSALIEEDQNE